MMLKINILVLRHLLHCFSLYVVPLTYLEYFFCAQENLRGPPQTKREIYIYSIEIENQRASEQTRAADKTD